MSSSAIPAQTKKRARAIIVAAGSGERMGGLQKAFVPLLGRVMAWYSLRALEDAPEIDDIVLVVAADSREKAESLVVSMKLRKVAAICVGGATRRASVLAGLDVAPQSEITLVHDGARPCVAPELIARGVAAATKGAAVPAVPVQDTIKEAEHGGRVLRTPDRSALYAAQTPQVFLTELLKRAHHEAPADVLLDDASLFEALGWPVHIFEGDPSNLKVTRPIDLAFAEVVLRRRGIESATADSPGTQ